jgi:hypothetical protein
MSASSTQQSKDNRFTTIYTNDGSNTIDPSNLQPGDIIYDNWSRTSNNGDMDHTEMYAGDNRILSHGGDPQYGPVYKDYSSYRKQHTMMVRRLNQFVHGASAYNNSSTSGGSSGTLLDYAPSQYVYAAAGSGLLDATKPKQRRIFKGFAGRGTEDIKTDTTTMLNNIKNNITSSTSSGSISSEVVEKLLKVIVELLEKISDNTVPVNQIYQALVAYTQGKDTTQTTTSSTTSNSSSNKSTSSSSSDDDLVDSNIKSLVGALAAIAKG